MDSLPHELVVRVCSFLCTASLCRLCGASKALRSALKDDSDAWENALQSTWWYPFDTLKRHHNFTFWCSRYAIRKTLPPGGENQKIKCQFAIVSFEDGEIIGRCELLHHEHNAYVDAYYQVRWILEGQFACEKIFPDEGEHASRKGILDIYSMFSDFTVKYTSDFDLNDHIDHETNLPGTVRHFFDGFHCPFAFMTELMMYFGTSGVAKLRVRQTFCEDVEDLYNRFLNYTDRDEHPNDSWDYIEGMREQFMNAEAIYSTRGYGIERKCIRDGIIKLCCEPKLS